MFLYAYVYSFKKLQKTEVPLIEKFYDHLKQKGCSENEYNHAKLIWDFLKCKNIKDYMRIYLMFDVLLFADIFENFRNMCMANYYLDPAYYYTSANLFWDACLKMSKV